jgi:tetratricopeptide (TPR) repeat protein
MKRVLFSSIFFAGLLAARAQLAVPAQALKALNAVVQAKAAAFTNSQALFASQNYAAAEAALEAANARKAGTPEWHAESGGALLHMAFVFKAQGDTQTVTQVVQLALNQYALAEQGYTSATVAAEVANEKTAVGYIYEHIVGDRRKAQQYYTQAVALSAKPGLAAVYLAHLNRSLVEEANKPGRATAP